MKQNLKTRLNRIRETREKSVSGNIEVSEKKNSNAVETALQNARETLWSGWSEAGFKTLKREISRELSIPVPGVFPKALAILIPDISRLGRIPSPDELLFFDLETTGLSGGAGTVAFLAAFGRFVSHGSGSYRLEIVQYLLLDYDGEGDFIEKIAAEFALTERAGLMPIVVSYNGKCFDSQILKNRCLMNAIAPPELFHADLLHPARRLWKQMLPDCSQSTVEVSVLGLDRAGDVSGAKAPEIWFSFLRSGENRELLSVCDHNEKDITGLASLFLAMGEIAASPVESREKYRFNEEAFALNWNKALKKIPLFFCDAAEQANKSTNESCTEYAKTGKLLLENAARNGSPKAAIILAIDAEWRLRDNSLALHYTDLAMASSGLPDNSIENSIDKFAEEVKRRRLRLLNKIS